MAATSIAISSAAMASSSDAISIAKTAECKILLNTFDSKNKPTVSEQREYSECVYRVHGDGEPMSDGAALILKIAILIVLVSTAYGGYKEFKYESNGGSVLDISMTSLIYALCSFMAIVCIALVISAICFIFS